MPLIVSDIAGCSDDVLFQRLSRELDARLPGGEGDDLDDFVVRLRQLPRGLRAMGSIYQLDVSMAVDDLGFHFANWHHHGYAAETLAGLRELEAGEVADVFAMAYALVRPHWQTIGSLIDDDFDRFADWYNGSDLAMSLKPLNARVWDWCETRRTHGLMTLWLDYARKYPERLAAAQ